MKFQRNKATSWLQGDLGWAQRPKQQIHQNTMSFAFQFATLKNLNLIYWYPLFQHLSSFPIPRHIHAAHSVELATNCLEMLDILVNPLPTKQNRWLTQTTTKQKHVTQKKSTKEMEGKRLVQLNGSKPLLVNPASRSEVENLAASLCHEIWQHRLSSNDELCDYAMIFLVHWAKLLLLPFERSSDRT